MQVIRSKIKSASIVMAIGVGGGGGNAVNHLYAYGERNISFLLFNTDRQSLHNSNIPEKYKIQLGNNGLGAGNEAKNGRQMALDSSEKIKEILGESGARMVFVIAGMGGGTGTGAAPVISEIARSMGILTIGVVTIPFESEGRPRLEQAIAGVETMSKVVDSLIIINNSHIAEIYGNLALSQAYFRSNELVAKAVKSISDIITKHFIVNVDFSDVCRVMRNSGVALMGTGRASGNNRAIEATEQALSSPLLHLKDITGAENVLVCITSSSNPEYELRMSDARTIPAHIQKITKTGNLTDIIWGAGYDDTLGEDMQVIVIATGFNYHNIPSLQTLYKETFETPKPDSKISVKPASVQSQPHSTQKPLPSDDGKKVQVFYEIEDSRPAFLRRSVKLGVQDESQKQGRRHKQKLESEEKESSVKERSLFDDF